MTPLGDAPAPPTPEQLLAVLKDPVNKIIKEEVSADIEPEKVWQYRQAQKNDLYWRQLQYITPYMADVGVAAFSPLGTPLAGMENRQNVGLYDYVQNIYRGYGRKFIAVLGQRAPNVKACPDDPQDDVSIAVTRQADIAAHILRGKWNAEERSLELALSLWKNGTTFAYTPWTVDGDKYGYREEPVVQAVQQSLPTPPAPVSDFDANTNGGVNAPPTGIPGVGTPDLLGNPAAPSTIAQSPNLPPTTQPPPPDQQINLPSVTGTQRYENGSVEFHLCNIYTVEVPFFARSLEDAPWLSYEYEEYKSKLKRLYPVLRKTPPPDGMGGMDSAASAIGTTVRDSSISPIGTPNPHRSSRWNYRRIWLTPCMFESVEDDNLRQLLYTNYRTGLKVTLVNGQVMELEEERLTDVWAMCKPDTSEYIFADAIGQDMVPIQDLKNDTLNLCYETFERGVQLTFADPRVIDFEQWGQKQSLPTEVIPVLAQIGDNLSSAFYQTEPSKVSDQLLPWMQATEEDAKLVCGTTDPIFGGGADAPTARQSELRKNAALQQLGTTYLYMRKFWERVYTNGVKQLARYGVGMLKAAKQGANGLETMLLDIGQLQEDGWHFESEEAIPMTWGQERDLLMYMLGQPEPIVKAFGFDSVRNMGRNQALLGMSGYWWPGLDEHEKAQAIINDLIKGKAVPQPGDDGAITMMPSIPIDDFEDDHQAMTDEAKTWCVSSLGRRIKRDNPDGYGNVVAWGLAHQKAAAPPPPPPPPVKPGLTFTGKFEDLQPDLQASVLSDFGIQVPQTQPGEPLAAPPLPKMRPDSPAAGMMGGAPPPMGQLAAPAGQAGPPPPPPQGGTSPTGLAPLGPASPAPPPGAPSANTLQIGPASGGPTAPPPGLLQ